MADEASRASVPNPFLINEPAFGRLTMWKPGNNSSKFCLDYYSSQEIKLLNQENISRHVCGEIAFVFRRKMKDYANSSPIFVRDSERVSPWMAAN